MRRMAERETSGKLQMKKKMEMTKRLKCQFSDLSLVIKIFFSSTVKKFTALGAATSLQLTCKFFNAPPYQQHLRAVRQDQNFNPFPAE